MGITKITPTQLVSHQFAAMFFNLLTSENHRPAIVNKGKFPSEKAYEFYRCLLQSRSLSEALQHPFLIEHVFRKRKRECESTAEDSRNQRRSNQTLEQNNLLRIMHDNNFL